MSKQLTGNELTQLLDELHLPRLADRLRAAGEAYMDVMTLAAESAAAAMGVRLNGPADNHCEQPLVGFSPRKPDDPMPSPLGQFDEVGDWEYLANLDVDDTPTFDWEKR